jgi:hypothetical protein
MWKIRLARLLLHHRDASRAGGDWPMVTLVAADGVLRQGIGIGNSTS